MMRNNQKGSVLIFSLIMLLLLTIVGVSGMQMTTLEEKMSGNYRNHELAFQAAEAALADAENYIEETPFDLTDFQPGCGSDNCFSNTCDGGLCFDGTFPASATPVTSCVRGTTKPWEDWARWADGSGQFRTADALVDISAQARYIIEFRCFIVKDAGENDPDVSVLSPWSLLFRVTALANGGTGDSQVMLQSTYKKIDF